MADDGEQRAVTGRSSRCVSLSNYNYNPNYKNKYIIIYNPNDNHSSNDNRNHMAPCTRQKIVQKWISLWKNC